jgi:hypothetical protein
VVLRKRRREKEEERERAMKGCCNNTREEGRWTGSLRRQWAAKSTSSGEKRPGGRVGEGSFSTAFKIPQ